ncbi:MAG: L-aspartate oxidase [Planctomycetota bacterium]|jgi:L-aspartate oxidase
MHEIFNQRRYLIPFRSTLLPQIFTDTVVVGSGVAGCRAALAAAEHGDVILVAKGKVNESSTAWAQGGIAVVTKPSDSIDDHVANTLEAGAGLCDESVVRQIISDGPARVEELIELGMAFDRDNDGDLRLGREGGHNAFRVLHADGDATGRAMAHTLNRAVVEHENVRLFDQCFVLDLLTDEGDGRCLGLITHHARFGLQVIWARAVILASGGCGRVYRESTNPAVATGDGLAMAWRAGASLADLEFMQFHPTALYVPGASRALITEAVRGEGAYLINDAGERFMPEEHELAELAPRDVVSRAIVHQLGRRDGANVYLDTRHLGAARMADRFPGITSVLRKFDIEPGRDLIPIRPAAHYMIGGLWVDDRCRTNIPGLYACGEASCTGLNGANRLASNSLLEGLVCGAVAGQTCAEMLTEPATPPAKIVSDIPLSNGAELDIADVRSTLRSIMWRRVGIERDGERLGHVEERFDYWARYTLDKIFDDRAAWEAQNMLWVGAMMTRAARVRRESRGTHWRIDRPRPDDTMRHHHVWQKGESEHACEPLR